jgi:hypothetical protein
MAPEEILGSADAGRRDFLKKVLAGTTFAAPVIASFSMEGLSPENAWANGTNMTTNQSFCSNMPTSLCCAFAAEIAQEIWGLGGNFVSDSNLCGSPEFLPPLEVRALFLGQLGEALEHMAEGIKKGKGDCTKKSAVDQFKKAAKDLEDFEELVDSFCQGKFAEVLIAATDLVICDIGNLVDGSCVPCPRHPKPV